MVILKFFLFIDLLLVEEGVIYLDFCFVEFWCVELYDFGLGGIGGGVVDVFFGDELMNEEDFEVVMFIK